MICFVFAMDSEAKFLLEAFPHECVKYGFAKRYICHGPKGDFLVVISGIGKVFAAAGLSAVLAKEGEQIKCVINLGVGGSLDGKKAPFFSCLIGENYLQHDLDTSPIGDPVGMVSGINVIRFPGDKDLISSLANVCIKNDVEAVFGTIASGDQFIADVDSKKKILSTFSDVISVDMESASFAQVAYCYNVPFVAARFVSDVDNSGEYALNLPRCASLLAQVALTIIRNA